MTGRPRNIRFLFPWRYMVCSLLGVAVYLFLAWLPDHDIWDANLWALAAAFLFVWIGLEWQTRAEGNRS